MSIFLHPEILRYKLYSLRKNKKEYVVALPYLLQAISNLFLSMPITELKYVKVKFYKSGLLTIVKKGQNHKFGIFKRITNDILSLPLQKNDEELPNYDPDLFSNFCENEVESNYEMTFSDFKSVESEESEIFTFFEVSNEDKKKYKNIYANQSNMNRQKTKSSIYKEILNSPHFYDSEIDWLEAGLQLLKQAHIILTSILYSKDLSFYSIDSNFNLMQLREITTKERKRGRVGLTFHFLREFCKIIKSILDTHIAYRSGLIDVNKHLNTIYEILTGLGKYSGIYRYKYRIMRQIKECKRIEKRDRMKNEMSIGKLFKVWQSFLRGYIPLFYKFGSNLSSRILSKRVYHPKTISKQRIETFQELYTRDLLLSETSNKNLLAHLTEAWRSFKACLEYSTNNAELDKTLAKYLKEKEKRYYQVTIDVRKRIITKSLEKSIQKKNIGRITRLYLRKNIELQNKLMNERIQVDQSVKFYRIYEKMLKNISIPFPSSITNELNIHGSEQSLEQKIYTEMISKFKCGEDEILSLLKIKENLSNKRTFSDIKISLRDNIDHAHPIYEYDVTERQVDSFLDLWISHFYHKEEKFFVDNLRELQNYVFFTTLEIYFEKFDFNLLYHILKLFLDEMLVEYIIARCNCVLTYKDMTMVNRIGILKGFEFSHILFNLLFSVVDHFLVQEGVFFIREDQKVIIATNEKTYSTNELNAMLPGSFDTIFQLKNVKQTEKMFEFYDCISLNQKCELKSLNDFKHQIRNINSNQTFLRIIEQWNTRLLNLVVTFREFITKSQIKEINQLEKRIKNLIKGHINSKMPIRFPNLIYYVPLDLGGLGMLSASNDVISILDYIDHWSKIDIEKHKRPPTFARNERSRHRNKKYFTSGNFFHRFTSEDGRLWSLDKYKYDMTDFFGGTKEILRRSIISKICDSFDTKLLWETQIYSSMTKAQLSGASIYPNKKFVLFWSPLINTSNVYVGYPVQIDRSGIVMYGKLASLKISYVKLFRDNLWIKICENFVSRFAEMNKCRKLSVDKKKWYSGMGIDAIFESCVFLNEEVSFDTLQKTKKNNSFTQYHQENLWMDLQVRWGNFDSCSIQEFSKIRYNQIIQDPLNQNRKEKGFVVALDILYKDVAIFGYLPANLLLPDLNQISEYDSLRKRILKALGLNLDVRIYDIKDLIKKPLRYEEFKFDAKKGTLIIEKEESLDHDSIKLDQTDGPRSKCKIFFPALRTLLNEQLKLDLSCGENEFNMYKYWPYQPFTNFCKLVLILNAFRVARSKVLEIDNLFGAKSNEEQIVIEYTLKNLIIENYRQERNIKRLLSLSETRDIVFGKEIELFRDLNVRTRDKIGTQIDKNIQTNTVEVDFEKEWVSKFKNINSLEPFNIEYLTAQKQERITIRKNHLSNFDEFFQIRIYRAENKKITLNSKSLQKLYNIASGFSLFIWILQPDQVDTPQNEILKFTNEDNILYAIPPQSCRNGILRLSENLNIEQSVLLGFILVNSSQKNYDQYIQQKYKLKNRFTQIKPPFNLNQNNKYYFLIPNIGYNFYFTKFDQNSEFTYHLNLPAHFMDLEHRKMKT